MRDFIRVGLGDFFNAGAAHRRENHSGAFVSVVDNDPEVKLILDGQFLLDEDFGNGETLNLQFEHFGDGVRGVTRLFGKRNRTDRCASGSPGLGFDYRRQADLFNR